MKNCYHNPGLKLSDVKYLNPKDIKYLSKKLSTSPEIIKKLTEDESDLNLILDKASVTDIKKEDSLVVSPLVYIKLLILRYSQDTGFALEEKNYIAGAVFDYYLEIVNGIDYLFLCSKTPPNEEKSRYFLVLSGFHYDRVHPKLLFPGFEKLIADGFRKNEKLKNLASNVPSWIDICHEIKKKRYLGDPNRLLLTDKIQS